MNRDQSPSRTDVLVIGAGPGGYVAAIRAAQLGLDTTLVERDAYGGVCLNRGCIPSKALISATDLAYEAGHAEQMGIHADPFVDVEAMVEWKDSVVDQLTAGVEKLCRANGITLVEGRAEFVDETSVQVIDGADRSTEMIEFEHTVIATGSRPVEIAGFKFSNPGVLDSRLALSLRDTPSDLVVIGAGYIGMELSTVFARLGTKVTVVEMLDSVLPTYAEDLTHPVRKCAKELGITFRLGELAREWREDGDGRAVITEDEDGTAHEYYADRVLVAVGREPVTDTLNLEATGIEPNEEGFIETDDQARTAKKHVFAVGDVAGEPMLAHKGMREGEVAAEAIAGESTTVNYRSIPAAVFTDPEIGTVGMTERQAEEAGVDPVTGKFPFRASGRALTTGHDDGFVRVIADRESGRLLGGQIVGPEASELIAEITLAVETCATLEDLIETLHTHPTLSEAVKEAAANARNRAIHTANR